MKGPCTYAEWLTLLDRFRSGDDSTIQVMENGSVEWTNIVAERWTRQVVDALGDRLLVLSKQLQMNLDRARGDYFAISNTLVAARRGLVAMRAFVALPCFPETVRNHLASELTRWISETQKSLEKGAIDVRHDQGRLLKTLRDAPLGTTLPDNPSVPDGRVQEEPIPPAKWRRVIL